MLRELRNPNHRWKIILVLILTFFLVGIARGEENRTIKEPAVSKKKFKKLIGYRSYEHEDGKVSREELVILGEEGEYFWVHYVSDAKSDPLKKVLKSLVSLGAIPRPMKSYMIPREETLPRWKSRKE